MRYNQLGSTGLFVSEFCLGTMTFGGGGIYSHMGSLQQPEADKLVARSLEAGINFIDTADIYSNGQAEIITGQALRNLNVKRSDVVMATKVFAELGPGPNQRGSSRGHIFDGITASLARLQLDYVDLYQLHGFDPLTPIEESMRALDDVVRRGLVRYIGVSNWAAWQIAKSLGISALHQLSKFASLQAYYTVAGRDLEREIIPLLRSEGLGLLVWSPLAGGLLSGKYKRDEKGPDGNRRTTFDFPPVNLDRAYSAIDVMSHIASGKQVSVAQIALSWLLHQPSVTSIILGARNAEQLNDNLAASDVTLSEADLSALNEVSELPAEYPTWMFARQQGSRLKQAERARTAVNCP